MSIYNQISAFILVLVLFSFYKLFRVNKNDGNQHLTTTGNENNHGFTELQQYLEVKVRRRWLISFSLMTIISTFSVFLSIISEFGIDEFSHETSYLFALIVYLFFSSLVILPWFWITYHCSYKKKGTAWLCWMMFTIPGRELLSISRGEWSGLSELDVLSGFFVFIYLGIEAYFWMSCLSLYKINSARKQFQTSKCFNDSVSCTEYVSKMEQSSTMSDLDKSFYDAIGCWPQWERQLSAVYHKCKSKLLTSTK